MIANHSLSVVVLGGCLFVLFLILIVALIIAQLRFGVNQLHMKEYQEGIHQNAIANVNSE